MKFRVEEYIDTGFENLWGLQDCAETLYEFGTEDQRERYIPAYVPVKQCRWTLPNPMPVPTFSR